MKIKHFIFAGVLLFVTSFVHAQTIHPDYQWRVDASEWEPDLGIYYHYYKDSISGDTVIDSKQYYKIYRIGYWTCESWKNSHASKNVAGYLSGFLREENNRWYTWANDEDKLLFDFNLQVNDTVVSAFTISEEPITITAIDSVLVGDEYKKRFHLNNFGAEYIIEGIGATSGLFENMYFFEWWSELICYSRNGISFWGATTEDCELIIGVDETEMNRNQLLVFPNPAEDFVKINWPSAKGDIQLTLVNATGIIVKKQKLDPAGSNTVSISELQTGIYFIILENGRSRICRKIMVR